MLRGERFTVVLPIALTNDNEGRTKHYGTATKRRRQYEATFLSMGLRRTPPPYQQHVTITRVLGPGQSKFDPDSLGRGNAKEIIDSLTALGWWVDDSAKWICAVDYRQDDSRRRQGPAVEISVRPCH